MATTQHILKTYYVHLVRTAYNAVPPDDAISLSTMALAVDQGTLSLTAARQQIVAMAHETTSVANLSYQFFTGGVPSHRGLDYLVSPTGPNPNNLNSTYYQAFNIENRFINFSVNLGKLGEGQAGFAAAYGNLTLQQAMEKAYAEIFGFAPGDLIATLLAEQVQNGSGGSFTRADYFASYGGDGQQSIGTKAAATGWLLAEAVKSGLGGYAQANLAFLNDLAPDNLAKFNTDIVSSYAPAPVPNPGATLTFAANESISPGATQPNLRSTIADDTISSSGALNAGQTIDASAGADMITIGGTSGGHIRGGAGRDTVTVATLPASISILGAATNGTISGEDGNDTIIVTTQFANGAVIEGGAGDDMARVALVGELMNSGRIGSVEHLEISSFQVQFGGIDVATFAPNVIDITTTAENLVRLSNIPDGVALVMRDVDAGGGLNAAYTEQLVFSGKSSTTVGADRVDIYIDDVQDAVPVTISGIGGPVRMHVASDSILGTLTLNMTNSADRPVLIEGLGRLTAAFTANQALLDASAAAGVDIKRFGSDYKVNTATLSTQDDRIAIDLLRSVNAAVSTYTLGAGADVVTLYQDPQGFNAPRFGNLHITGSGADAKVDAWAAITDFTKGQDLLDLGPAIAAVTSGLSAGSAISLEQALINVTSQVVTGAVGVFEYAGDTWVYRQDATVGVNAGDGLIRLIGVTGLTVGTGTSVDIHYG